MIRKEISLGTTSPVQRRDAAKLVQIASRFESRLVIEHDSKVINAKSMLGLLSLGQIQAGKVYLVADGDDEKAAVDAIVSLVEKGFEE
ncbi:MAG: HPr family phosphocarrier protein [Eubacteriales bacterium]|nr:HPr family phosphocarrier protein [Eubacteriales bacterium]MDD3881419.1 HPr family phosphocarrier protein [Eubacteriales bacterium]